ncbi:MAG: hypothetical protein R2715_12055 [Ilumatobacteraceae bacterium]
MKALVRKPSPRLEEGSVVHIERSAVDFELAVRQWDDYVDALRDHGWDIIEVPEDDESPDGVFIEDAVLMYEQVAIVTRPGTPSRTAEPASVEPVVRSLGYDVHRIEAPGTLEGGDVLKVGSTISSASPARPTPPGVEQVQAILEPAGATVIAVPVTKALHLKSAITALPDGTIIGWSDVVDDPSIFEVSGDARGPGAHRRPARWRAWLLISSAAPKSAALLASLGYEPVPVDVGEYEKLEGCVTCLSVRLRSNRPRSDRGTVSLARGPNRRSTSALGRQHHRGSGDTMISDHSPARRTLESAELVTECGYWGVESGGEGRGDGEGEPLFGVGSLPAGERNIERGERHGRGDLVLHRGTATAVYRRARLRVRRDHALRSERRRRGPAGWRR